MKSFHEAQKEWQRATGTPSLYLEENFQEALRLVQQDVQKEIKLVMLRSALGSGRLCFIKGGKVIFASNTEEYADEYKALKAIYQEQDRKIEKLFDVNGPEGPQHKEYNRISRLSYEYAKKRKKEYEREYQQKEESK